VLAELLRLLAEIGPGAIWVFIFIAAVIAAFVVYVGIALVAALFANDPKQQEVRRKILRDLLRLFRRRRHR
jgi:hypothetical protein